jgi:DNA primase
MDYLKSRMLDENDIKKYSLGYANVINVKDDGSEDYKRFSVETYEWKTLRSKILFPLHNSKGDVNGLISRSIDPEYEGPKYKQLLTTQAKYIGAFFGLPQALPEIQRTGTVYVVEGAIDCISLSKVLPNTVSVLTAFINEEQYWILKTIADKICVVFDSDDAGKHGQDIVKNKYKDNSISFSDLGYNDANSCLNALGSSKFDRYVKRRLSVLRF